MASVTNLARIGALIGNRIMQNAGHFLERIFFFEVKKGTIKDDDLRLTSIFPRFKLKIIANLHDDTLSG